MLKLKLQYFGQLMQIVDSLEKNPDTGKDWGQEEKGTTEDKIFGGQVGITDSMDMSLRKLQEMVKDREACVLPNWESEQQQQKRHSYEFGKKHISMMSSFLWPNSSNIAW